MLHCTRLKTPSNVAIVCIYLLYVSARAQKTPEVDFWSRINTHHIEYNPVLAKHVHPPAVAGQQWKLAADDAKGNLAAYFQQMHNRVSAGRVAAPFKPLHYIGLVNVDHRLMFFKPLHTAGLSLWQGWIEPALCPARSPGVLLLVYCIAAWHVCVCMDHPTRVRIIVLHRGCGDHRKRYRASANCQKPSMPCRHAAPGVCGDCTCLQMEIHQPLGSTHPYTPQGHHNAPGTVV